jgi:hypothetical protein
MAIKLTPTQRRNLEVVRDHGVYRYREWGGGFHWGAAGASIRPSTMNWLLSNRLIRAERVGVVGWGGSLVVLTDAGREALGVGRTEGVSDEADK